MTPEKFVPVICTALGAYLLLPLGGIIMIEGTRSLIRPLVTLSFVWAYIYACLQGDVDPNLLGKLETLTGVVVAFWFSERSNRRNGSQTVEPPQVSA